MHWSWTGICVTTDSSDNLMNLLFCVFLSVGNSLLTLGLRQAGSKFFFLFGNLRPPSMVWICWWIGSWDWYEYLHHFGLDKIRKSWQPEFVRPDTNISGCFEFVRIWKHLGPEEICFPIMGKHTVCYRFAWNSCPSSFPSESVIKCTRRPR